MDPLKRKKKAKPTIKKERKRALQRSGKQSSLTHPRKQVFKKDGTVILVSSPTRAEA